MRCRHLRQSPCLETAVTVNNAAYVNRGRCRPRHPVQGGSSSMWCRYACLAACVGAVFTIRWRSCHHRDGLVSRMSRRAFRRPPVSAVVEPTGALVSRRMDSPTGVQRANNSGHVSPHGPHFVSSHGDIRRSVRHLRSVGPQKRDLPESRRYWSLRQRGSLQCDLLPR